MLLLDTLFIFSMGSIFGWLIELFYVSIVDKKRLINPGFLSGPYIPIYGFSFSFLYIISSINIDLYIKIPIFVLGVTLVEFLGGLFFLKIFKLRLWNYQNNKFNILGLICPLFSFYWLLISLFFYFILYPGAVKLILFFNKNYISFIGLGFFYGLLIEDMIISFEVAARMKLAIKQFNIRQKDISSRLKSINLLNYKHFVSRKLKCFNLFIHSHHFNFRESMEKYFNKIKNLK